MSEPRQPVRVTAKTQVSPPLDLSDGHRKVESPLDLSVKKQKRPADTTDYGEPLSSPGLRYREEPFPKRMCFTKKDYAYPPGHPNSTIQEDDVTQNRVIKMRAQQQQQHIQQQQHPHMLLKNMPSSASVTYPGAISEQVSGSTVKYASQSGHSPSLFQHKPYDPMDRSQQKLPPQRQMPAPTRRPPIAPQTTPPGPSSHSIPQQVHRTVHPVYETARHNLSQRPPVSNMTESVALQGFFEPTQKVTVNPPKNPGFERGKAPESPAQAHVLHQEYHTQHGIGRSDLKEMEEHRRMLATSSAVVSAGFTHSPMYPSNNAAPRLFPQDSIPPQAASDVDLLHQRQAEARHYQQLQMQKRVGEVDQMMLMHRAVIQKSASEQGHKPVAMDACRPSEMSAAPQRFVADKDVMLQAYPAGHSQLLSATSPRQTHYPDSIRHEKADLPSSIRCMTVGQPVPLPEIAQQHSIMSEKIQTVQNHADVFRGRIASSVPQNINVEQSRSLQYLSPSNVPLVSSRYEQSSTNTGKDQYARVGHGERSIPHPSVIQRPQGFIPPKIVRRTGSTDMMPTRRDDTERGRPMMPLPTEAETRRDQQFVSVRQEMVGPQGNRPLLYSGYKDMLTGRDVLKIQQRVAEQRHEATHKHFPVHKQRRSIPDIDEAPYTERRRSVHEGMQGRAPIKQDERQSIVTSDPGVSNTQARNIPVSAILSHSQSESTLFKPTVPSGRSITKGTSGIKKEDNDEKKEMLTFDQVLLRELKKNDSDSGGNPFANRSLLQEFDRSANSSPHSVSAYEHTSKVPPSQSSVSVDQKVHHTPLSDSSYTMPLQIAIPGHKKSLAQQSTPTLSTTVTSSLESLKQEVPMPSKKFMSRKHMILNAFRHDEDLKNSSECVGKDQKCLLPGKVDKDATSQSPKMPILSPQERNANAGSGMGASKEPPNLKESTKHALLGDANIGKLNRLEEHLHLMITNALNNENSEKDGASKKDVVEDMCRKFKEMSQQGHNLNFLVSRQNSQSRNIPVANVAPIVHGKSVSESLSDKTKNESVDKYDIELSEEDEKMAAVVTRSLFDIKQHDDEGGAVLESSERKQDESGTLTREGEIDENSNSTSITPGLKSLIGYRQRDVPQTSPHTSASDSNRSSPRSIESNRNIFGEFSKIVGDSQNIRAGQSSVQQVGPGGYWQGYHSDTETHVPQVSL